MLCDPAESKADADPPNAHIVTWDLLRETQPLLVIMDAVLSEGDAMRLGAHDEVASTALRCEVTLREQDRGLANRTHDA